MYEIAVRDDSVGLWLSCRLPLLWEGKKTERNAGLYDARRDLRTALVQLKRPDGHNLEASLFSESPERFDLENVLFYNVGSGPFSRLMGRSLSFSRRWKSPPPSPSGRSFDYYSEYKIVENAAVSLPAHGTTIEFPWSQHSSVKTDMAWWLAANAVPVSFTAIEGRFAVHVAIEAAYPMSMTVDKLKWLLDGLISSCHADPDPAPADVEKLAIRNGWSATEVRRKLIEPPNPILGSRRVYRGAWNPADDLCDECHVRIVEARRSSCRFTISALDVPQHC